MKLLDRLLLWVLTVLAVAMGLLLILLALFPAITWLQVPAVRIAVGVTALLGVLAAVALLLRRVPRQKKEAALVDEGENGSAYVTLGVINDMARRIVQETEGVRTCRSAVKNNGSGVDVELELALHPGVAVVPLAARLQERLKTRIFEMTGIRIGRVSIMVEAAAEGNAPQQAPVELLPERVDGGDKL